jgi:hypothetical protein
VQTLTLQAFDYQGNPVGTDTITITGTGGTLSAAAGNLVISEIHYNPANPTGGETAVAADNDEFEFIELRNISAQTVSLAGCRITGGIDYTFENTTLAAGAYAVVPRNTAAFAARYPGVPTLTHYYVAGTNFLRNSGDTLTLLGANGLTISTVAYNDSGSVKWPASPDGNGPSLVLIAPLTNPDAADPLHWRASTASGGNPGTSDAIAAPVAPTPADLLAYAVGTGTMPIAGSELVLGQRTMNFTLERNPLADADWTLESTAALTSPWTAAGATYEITARTALIGGNERITLRATTPMSGTSGFLRGKLRVP